VEALGEDFFGLAFGALAMPDSFSHFDILGAMAPL
jgi:hypothetical protein